MKETQFDKDIALTPISDNHYQVDISDTWNVTIGPNGGYVAAIILNGMKAQLGDVQTRSVTLHYLSASVPGPAVLHVNVEKKGRSLSTCTARLLQGERTIAISMATFASAREFYSFRDFDMPVVPSPDDIAPTLRMNPNLVGHVPFRDHFDQRLAIGPIPPATADEGRVGGWTRFVNHREYDDLAIVAISDSWFPGLNVKDTPVPMHAPTVDHSVHFLTSVPLDSIKIDDFLLVEFTTHVAQEGYLLENGKIWSTDGDLIAQSRQLAIMLPRDDQSN
ncbi:MAG: thioesterase family protein [Gammaproteobacteria bacterium]|nr:thioesterase family protein [Gammaproteobacteria bacterium]